MINISKTLRVNPSDPTAGKKVYATVQVDETYDLDAFARHIADHGSTYSRADVSAVLILAVDCMRELLLSGAKVDLGDLGTFRPAIRTEGAESADAFTANNIKKVNVRWTPGKPFKSLRDDAEFRFVPTRASQQALLAAQNANQGSVSITLPTTAGGTGSTGGTNPPAGGNDDNGGGSTGGDNQPPTGGSGDDGMIGG